MIVAGLALFVALAGTATAARLISGGSIRKHSIPADRLKRDTIGPAYVRESKLATVPRAKVAGSAFSVDGFTIGKRHWEAPRNTADQLIVNQGGFQVYARCPATGGPVLRGVTTTSGTQLRIQLVGANNTPRADVRTLSPGQSGDLDQGLVNASGTFQWRSPSGYLLSAQYGFDGCRLDASITAG